MTAPILGLFRHKAPLFCAFLAFALVLVLSGSPLHAQSAKTFFKRGQAAEARQDYDAAFENYQQAATKNPKDLAYRTALVRIRVSASGLHMTKGRKLLQAGDQAGALAEFLHAAEIDPSNEAAQQEIARVKALQGQAPPPEAETNLPESPGEEAELDALGPPVTLKPLVNEPLTIHYSEDAKIVYQAIGKMAGINVLFDPDYNSKRIQVDLNNSTLLDALRIVATESGTFWRPITSNTIFVAQNTRAKRTELEEQAVQTFYLSNAWQQNDLNDVQTAIRNVLTNVKVYGVQSQNAIVVRGTPDELLLAQKLVNDLDKARPEVVVDIAVLEVSKNWERTLGIAWPSSIGVALQPPCTASNSSNCNNANSTGTVDQTGTTTGTTGATPSLYDLSHLKASDFAITIGSATANLLLTNSNTKILQNPRIRATDAQKATLTIGEKIPIATGSYQTGAATALVSSLVNTQFQFEDVGVKIEMTPTVHYDHDVTLKVRIEVSSEAGSTTISGVTEPIIAQNIVDQVIRLREGEASILGGIEQKQETESWNGIPGLSAIPILKYLFGSKDHTINDEDLVFLLVPHIVRSQELDAINLRTIDTGVGNQIELRHLSAPASQPAPAPAVLPVRPPSGNRSSVGTVQGQSAEAAAPAALQQLHQAADTAGTVATDAAATQVQAQPGAPAAPAQPVNIALIRPSGPVAVGSTFKVPVVLNGGKDVASVPLQIQYDPAKLSLVNVDQGDFLGRGGQAVALVHREDGSGNVTINTALPPGAAGVNGAGTVCTLSFTAKAPGETTVAITRPAALNSAQQPLQAIGGQASIQIQ
jgi:general secretion pathway protein D